MGTVVAVDISRYHIRLLGVLVIEVPFAHILPWIFDSRHEHNVLTASLSAPVVAVGCLNGRWFDTKVEYPFAEMSVETLVEQLGVDRVVEVAWALEPSKLVADEPVPSSVRSPRINCGIGEEIKGIFIEIKFENLLIPVLKTLCTVVFEGIL